MMSNSIAPSVTPPSPNEYPNTIRVITNITNNNLAKVTSPNHGFTSLDQNLTSVMFLQVKGMRQINSRPGRIQQVIDINNFTVDINSTNFYPYISDGVISIDTGSPPIEQASFQTFNTPFQNIA
jgi:hypothetical protein